MNDEEYKKIKDYYELPGYRPPSHMDIKNEEPFGMSESIRKRPIYRNDFSGRSYTPGDYGEIAPYPCQKESLWEKIMDWIKFFGVGIGYLANAVCEWVKERL